MSKNYFIGVDVGTSLIKSVIFDGFLNEFAKSESQISLRSPYEGWVEADMNEVWEATKESLKKVINLSEIDINKIRFISITGQGSGCWMIDNNGFPSRNAILWSDARAASIIDEWNKNGVSELVNSIALSTPFAGLQGPIVKWLKLNEPEVLKKTRWIFYCRDWIRYKFTKKIYTDCSDASQTLINTKLAKYSEELFKAYDIIEFQHLFPELIPKLTITSKILPEVAKDIGLNDNLPIVTSPLDVVSCGLGVGAINPGDAYTILGTTCANCVLIDEKALNINHKAVMTYYFGLDGVWERAVASMLGTPNLDWFIEQFCFVDKDMANKRGVSVFQLLDEKISKIDPSFIIYHPYLSKSGERAPFVKKSATAQFFGLNNEHTRYHLYRSIYEGIAFAIKDCFNAVPVNFDHITISGGGAKSGIWLEIIANITGKSVKVTEGKEFGAKGAVMCGLVELGYYKNLKEVINKNINIIKVYSPEQMKVKLYNKIFKLYKDICNNNWTVWDNLFDLKNNL